MNNHLSKSVAFTTLGCKTNQYETDALMDIFLKNGFTLVDFNGFSSIYVINTCTVTHISDRKSRQMIRRAKKNNPNAIVIAVGCYAQISPNEVAKIEDVDIVIGTNARHNILDYLAHYEKNETDKPYVIVSDIMKIRTFEELQIVNTHAHTRAFIKIQEGCNQFCAYCIIPYARGTVRSRTQDNILREIELLSQKGFSEFVLTGIHIASYGIDLEETRLIDLIAAIHNIEGVKRIRLGSLEPRLISQSFIDRLKSLPKVCDHFHLSLQSGSDTVLKRMNRKYTISDYRNSVKRIRDAYEKPSITTDIIVGFPGETETEFNETLQFVKTIGFSDVHVFKFSPRSGTPAALMTDQIGSEIKKNRSEKLIQETNKSSDQYRQFFIGKIESIILEEIKNEKWIGHSRHYLKIEIPHRHEAYEISSIVNVRITGVSEDHLIGQFI